MANLVGRPDIKKYAGQGKARSEDNSLQAAIWVYRWGWTTAQIINRVLDLKRPGLADELVKKGVLERLDTPPGWRESFTYILAAPWVERVQLELDELAHAGFAMQEYTLHISKRVPWSSLHTHNMVAQHVLLDLIGPRPAPNTYRTEPEFRSDDEDRLAVPDFAYTDGGAWVHAEIELNHKEEKRLKHWLWLRLLALQNQDNLRLRIFSPLASVRAAIEEQIWKRRNIWPMERGASGKIYERQDKVPLELAHFRDRITIEGLRKSLDRRTGGLAVDRLLAEMPDGLPRVEGWDTMPAVGKEKTQDGPQIIVIDSL